MDRGAWQATVHAVAKVVRYDLVTKQQQLIANTGLWSSAAIPLFFPFLVCLPEAHAAPALLCLQLWPLMSLSLAPGSLLSEAFHLVVQLSSLISHPKLQDAALSDPQPAFCDSADPPHHLLKELLTWPLTASAGALCPPGTRRAHFHLGSSTCSLSRTVIPSNSQRELPQKNSSFSVSSRTLGYLALLTYLELSYSQRTMWGIPQAMHVSDY